MKIYHFYGSRNLICFSVQGFMFIFENAQTHAGKHKKQKAFWLTRSKEFRYFILLTLSFIIKFTRLVYKFILVT